MLTTSRILGAVAFAAATIGYQHRRRHRPGDTGHIAGMGTAYVTMLTAFYVDNGPHLPLWDRLPTLTFWLLPAAIGAPIITRAIISARLREMMNLWFAEAGANQAFPLDDRNVLELLTTPRPSLSPPRSRYVYYPDVADVPESQSVNIRNRSYTIGAQVDIPAPGAEGVLFAHGSRFGGHALYIKDGRLHYAYNFVGSFEQHVAATEDVPTGENLLLSASFDKDGEDPPGVATGLLSLHHADKKVGEARIRTQPGKFMIGEEGLCVGRDSGEPVTDDYPGTPPHRFTGGTIKRVAVDVSGEPYVDLEREAQAMLIRE